MQSVAFARPSRPVTLRESRPPGQTTLRRIGELGRLALTALVLAVGLGGAAALMAAAPAHAAAPVPVASPAHAGFRAHADFTAHASFTAHAGSVETSRPVVAASRVDALRSDSAELRPAPAARRAPRSLDAAPRPAAVPPVGAPVDGVSLDHPAVDPTTGTVVRRGPPRH